MLPSMKVMVVEPSIIDSVAVGITKQRYALLSVSGGSFYCPCCVIEQQNNAIIALQDTIKTFTMQLSELEEKCTEQSPSTAEHPSDTAEQPWTAVIKKGPQSQVARDSRGKGKGKDVIPGVGVERKKMLQITPVQRKQTRG